MSKSRGNVIYADDLVKLFGVDAVRFFVMHEMPFENDGVISWELMVERFNSQLANILGNLVKRTISMSNKYFDGIVEDKGVTEPVDQDLKNTVLEQAKLAASKMDELKVADALTAIFEIFRRSNKYIDETEPWVLAKEESKADRLRTVLYNLTESIVIGASLLKSFMPSTGAEILEQLSTTERDYASLSAFGLYPSGKITEAQIAKAQAEEKKEETKKAAKTSCALGSSQATGNTDLEKGIDIPFKAEIAYEDFDKCDFRIGKIIHAEEVKKSKKLLLFKVQVGSEVRQILSGIKSSYKPEDLLGKKVMVLCNLAPREICGYQSEGMLLSAIDEEGKLSLMTSLADMPAGASIS